MTTYCGEMQDITEGSSWDVQTCYRPMGHDGEHAYSLERPGHIRRFGECADLFDVTDGSMLGSGARAWFRCNACAERDRASYAAVYGPDVEGLAVYAAEGR